MLLRSAAHSFFSKSVLIGGASVRFTDREKSFEKDVTWYPYEKNYLGTIVDEHYYRANDYLLENADRYNYYYRAYENGKLVEDQVSKVFVGEYASSDRRPSYILQGISIPLCMHHHPPAPLQLR